MDSHPLMTRRFTNLVHPLVSTLLLGCDGSWHLEFDLRGSSLRSKRQKRSGIESDETGLGQARWMRKLQELGPVNELQTSHITRGDMYDTLVSSEFSRKYNSG